MQWQCPTVCQSFCQTHPYPGHTVSSRHLPGRSLRADLPQLCGSLDPKCHAITTRESFFQPSRGPFSDHTQKPRTGTCYDPGPMQGSAHHLGILGKLTIPMGPEELSPGVTVPDTRNPQSSPPISYSLYVHPTILNIAVSLVV